MKLLLPLAVLLAAAPARALVYAITNRSTNPVTVTVVNSSCDNKSRLIAVGGYAQMDWRGGCTDSCAHYFTITWTRSDGKSASTVFSPEFFSGGLMTQACRTQHITISDTPDDGPAVITGTTGAWTGR